MSSQHVGRLGTGHSRSTPRRLSSFQVCIHASRNSTPVPTFT
ncbi:hypothetical protein ACFPRL_11410 [Pseudoclavibacter helvolus]